MKFRILILVVLATPLWSTSSTLLIRNAWVVDGTGAAARKADVLVRGERIDAVAARLDAPAGAVVVDAAGGTLIPGLFDLHTHATYSAASGVSGDWIKNLKAYTYSGVTTIVDFGTYPEAFAPMRQWAAGSSVAPHLALAARFSTPLGHGAELGRDGFTSEVQTPAEARAAMLRVVPFRPDVIKVFTDGWRYGLAADMTSMTEATLATIVAEAHREGMRVLTHTVTVDRGRIAARAGVDCIDHAMSDRRAEPELAALLLVQGTSHAPTMAVYEPRTADVNRPFLRDVLEPVVRDSFNDRTPPAAPAAPELDPSPRQRRWTHILANVLMLHKAGVPIATGTDAGVSGTFHGWATLRELELLVGAGLTPLEAIRAGTLNAARVLRVDADRGTIAAGKRADLVLFAGRPQENISDVWSIRDVFLSGRRIDRDALKRDIQSAHPTPRSSAAASVEIDDFESRDNRSRTGALWSAYYESGHDHSRAQYARILRAPGNHALAVLAEMSERPAPRLRIQAPLSPGAFALTDASRFKGIQFEARGEGDYRVLLQSYAVRDGDYHAAPFQAGGRWRKIRIAFSEFKQSGPGSSTAQKPAPQLQAVLWEIARPAGARAWLELDNVRFY
ncbi:MAG: amidohydrolase family protein [Acidobacteriota bacterium]